MGSRSWPKAALVMVAGVGLSGCFQATFVSAQRPATEPVRSQYKSFYLLGLVGNNEVDVRSHCRSGRARQIRLAGNAGTLILSIATVGIYTPRMVYFTCEQGRGP